MEEENEVLDWGNEDDEQQHLELHRKSYAVDLDTRRGSGDVDDAEDTVSLGEDDDEQDYYAYQQQDSNATTATKDGKPPSTPKSVPLPNQTNNQQLDSSRELKRENSSASQNYSSSIGSPKRQQQSVNQQSPQRSHSFSAPRITHALPPKPVVVNVPFLHPSHPSIVEATAMSNRAAGRSESNKSRVNGSSLATTGLGSKSSSSGTIDSDSLPLPLGWEVRHPRSGGRSTYYYNVQTQESTWSRPVSSINSPPSLRNSRSRSARRSRDSSASAGCKALSPPKSDHSHSQELHSSSRGQPQLQPDFDVADPQRSLQQPVTPSLNSAAALSYEDRHYRPASADSLVTADNQRGDHNNDNSDPRYNLQSQHTFTPPVPPSRERERSPSPMLLVPPPLLRGRDSRDSHSGHGGRNSNTDADSSTQRDHDTPPAAFVPHRNTWNSNIRGSALSNPHIDVNHGKHQSYRRQHRQQHNTHDKPLFGSSAFENRPIIRDESTGRPNWDGKQPRAVEMHEQQNQNQNMSTPRIRSPLPHLHDRDQTSNASGDHESPQSTPLLSTTSSLLPPHRKRDRPTRFDRPSPSTSSVIAKQAASALTVAGAEQTLFQGRSREHDVYIPPGTNPSQQTEEEYKRDDDMNTLSASRQVVPASDDPSPKRARAEDRDQPRDWVQSSSDQGRSSPASETPTSRRKRVPLPPQSMRFREIASRPKNVTDHTGPYTQHRTQAQLSPSQTATPIGPRDQQQRSTNIINNSNNGLPSGPRYQPHSQGRDVDVQRALPSGPVGGLNVDRDIGQGGRQSSGTAHPQTPAFSENAMGGDVGDFPPTSRTAPSSRSSEAPIRAGSGMYADREVPAVDDILPRGPRAMSSKTTVLVPGNGPPFLQSPSTSSAMPHRPGPGAEGRIGERSPPHFIGHYVADGGRDFDDPRHRASGWREERENQGHSMEWGHREPRNWPNDFSRSTSSAPLMLSGTNSIPLRNRKGGGNGGGDGPTGGPSATLPGNRYIPAPGPSPAISTANMEPVQNARPRGAHLQTKETYERPPHASKGAADTYRTGLSADGPQQRRRDSPPAFERHRQPPLTVDPIHNPTRARRDTQYFGSDQRRFNPHPSIDPTRTSARIWTPREPSHRDSESDHRAAIPPLSREPSFISPSWDSPDRGRPSGRYSHHVPTMNRPDNVRGIAMNQEVPPKPQAGDPHAREKNRYTSGPEARRSRSLEGRLGERYDSRYVESMRQAHVQPPNPPPQREHSNSYSPEIQMKPPPDGRRQSDSFAAERPRPAWAGAPRDTAPHRPNENHNPGVFERQDFSGRQNRDIRDEHTAKMIQRSQLPLTSQQDDLKRAEPTDHLPPPHSYHRERSGDMHDQQFFHQQYQMNTRHGGSLLDRLSLDHGDDPSGDMSSQSLRDRVQIPSKRDREDVWSESYAMDDDDDSGDPASKRPRRRSGKPRRGKRVGP